MKTKAGTTLVKQNTKRMNQLYKEMEYLALELKKISPEYVKEDRHNSYGDPGLFQRLMDKVIKNRTEREHLQHEINMIVHLESFLP